MQLLVRTPQLHQLPVIVIALMRRRRERPPQRLHLRCMRTLSPRELNLRLRGRICHLGAPEPFRSGIVVECLAKLSLEILDVLRRLCSRVASKAALAWLKFSQNGHPNLNQSATNLNQISTNLNQISTNLNQSQPISTNLQPTALRRHQSVLWRDLHGDAQHTCPNSQSRRNQDLQGDAHLPELALRRPERLFERLLLIGQPPPLGLDRVLSTARLRMRENTQRGTRREARAERHAQRGTRREAHAERHMQRGTCKGTRREAHSEALTS